MGSAGRLGGAVALVTGGASGIGRAVCARLAREGARLAVADRDEEGAGDTVGGLHAGEGPHAGGGSPPRPHAAFGVDVASAPSVTRLLARVQEHFGGPPSICVGCAGVTRDEFLLRLGEGDFQEVLGVNLTVGNLGQANYAASKAGVEGLTRTCAKELARFGIRCNAVLPGFIVTPMTDKVPPKVLEKFAGMVPLGRLGDPQDVADVCAFLASGESSYITGASVEVTGGLFI
ncbi:(3R)-3-hydroxyacyl-CoA dehydrogenase isoform X3 [Calonectris borealis]|uniref:(3R)-3-hydroxyacyl-CoA dehydrogenase isoform X3 n=1 Tax=Calonectris borealis TaxID=1323832 RepID=UPI003F4B6845